ncbi:TolC family protein [Salinisphaera aquimarina]|uniref:TolC family protein n=1 Tax=Salinisphaera aquimarina TaxID=2094031 RepID=A0ABV7ENL4_9GAMM
MPILCFRASAFALGLCFMASAVPASAVTQITQPLTLDAALEWAQQYNPAVRAARLRVERLTGEAIHADVAVPSNPRVELEAGQRSGRLADTTDIGVRVSQELWIAGQGGLRQAAAESEAGAARSDYIFLQASVQARTRAAFLSRLAAQRAVETAQQVVEANDKLATYARKRLSAGAGTQLEANAAKLGQSRAQALLARARNRARQAGLALNDLLAVDPQRRLAVRGELGFAPLTLPSSDSLLTRSVERRTDLNAAAQRVVAAQKRLSLSRRQIIPNLTVFGFYRQEADGKGSGGEDITGGGIGFDVPILHRYEGERRVANAELGQALLEQDNLQREVRLQILAGMSDYDSASQQVAALNDAVLNAAQQTLDLTRRSFAAGQVAAPAITTAQNNLIAVRQDYLDALDALIAAGTDLERATGGLVVMQSAAHSSELNR